MRVYYISCPSSTFGQTDAGMHVSVGQEAIVASVGLDSTDAEIAAFMAEVRMAVCHNRKDQFLPHTREGLETAVAVSTAGGGSGPYVRPYFGDHRIHFGSSPMLSGPSVQLDGENLSYQRGVLAG